MSPAQVIFAAERWRIVPWAFTHAAISDFVVIKRDFAANRCNGTKKLEALEAFSK